MARLSELAKFDHENRIHSALIYRSNIWSRPNISTPVADSSANRPPRICDPSPGSPLPHRLRMSNHPRCQLRSVAPAHSWSSRVFEVRDDGVDRTCKANPQHRLQRPLVVFANGRIPIDFLRKCTSGEMTEESRAKMSLGFVSANPHPTLQRIPRVNVTHQSFHVWEDDVESRLDGLNAG